MIFKVWSTHKPAIVLNAGGHRVLAAGTISKVEIYHSGIVVRLPNDTWLPNWLEPQMIQWASAPGPVQADYTTRTVKGRPYIIKTYHSGREVCSCPGFMYRKHCKHLTQPV